MKILFLLTSCGLTPHIGGVMYRRSRVPQTITVGCCYRCERKESFIMLGVVQGETGLKPSTRAGIETPLFTDVRKYIHLNSLFFFHFTECICHVIYQSNLLVSNLGFTSCPLLQSSLPFLPYTHAQLHTHAHRHTHTKWLFERVVKERVRGKNGKQGN